MEQVRLRSFATQAKIIGAILSISGALVVVLYKGPTVLAAASYTPSSHINFLHQQLTSLESSWIIGGLLLASQYFLLSVWYILQVQTLEKSAKNTLVCCLHIKTLAKFSAAVHGFRLGSWRYTLKK